jgi:hypothetical protein
MGRRLRLATDAVSVRCPDRDPTSNKHKPNTLPPFITPNPATNSGDGAGIQSAFSKFEVVHNGAHTVH